MSALSEKSAFEAFARMEEKIDQSERQIRASAEIDEEFTGDRLAKDFKQLEQSGGVERRRFPAAAAEAADGDAGERCSGRQCQATGRGRGRCGRPADWIWQCGPCAACGRWHVWDGGHRDIFARGALGRRRNSDG